jgi:hypothetical protein
MNKEFDERLCRRYPKIFKNRRNNTIPMSYGFECNDGWFNIIDAMCKTIQNAIDESRHRKGYVLRYNRKLKRAIANGAPIQEEYLLPEIIPQVIALQLKEKFGRLTFYYEGGDSFIAGVVRGASVISMITCEICGNSGLLRTERKWIRCLCDNCKIK